MEVFNKLIGVIVEKIFISEDFLFLQTDDGLYRIGIEGECCSHSYFYDFVGANNIIGRKIINIEEIELDIKDTDIVKVDTGYGWDRMKDNIEEDEEIEVYGVRIIAEDEVFGELSGAFSFRNASNGYYGGWVNEVKKVDFMPEGMVEVKDYFTF